MTTFDDWLKQATRGLASESADRVRAENQQRYDSALAAAISQSADPVAAESIAISVLGDADTANFRYRRSLLTATEVRILRQGARERNLIVSHRWFLLLFSACRFGLLRSRQRTTGHRLDSSRTAAPRGGLGSRICASDSSLPDIDADAQPYLSFPEMGRSDSLPCC
jgi:hypothetical protein